MFTWKKGNVNSTVYQQQKTQMGQTKDTNLQQGRASLGPELLENILCFFSVKYTGIFTYAGTLGQVIAFLPWWGASGICAKTLSSQEEITSCPPFLGL